MEIRLGRKGRTLHTPDPLHGEQFSFSLCFPSCYVKQRGFCLFVSRFIYMKAAGLEIKVTLLLCIGSLCSPQN